MDLFSLRNCRLSHIPKNDEYSDITQGKITELKNACQFAGSRTVLSSTKSSESL